MNLYFRQSLLTGFCLTSLLLVINYLPNDGLVFPQLINSGHAFVFFCANLFLLKLLLGTTNTYSKVLFISLFSILIGFLIECVQPYIGRDRSVLDFYYDCIGVLFSAIFFIRTTTKPRKAASFLLILLSCLALAFPAFRLYLWWQINHSPILLNFERNWEDISLSGSEGVTIEKTRAIKSFKSDSNVGKIYFGMSGTYPGFGLDYPRNDWSCFTELSWEVVSSNDHPIDINLRIHDAGHNQEYNDRFNFKFTVMPGFNVFTLALTDIKNGPTLRQIDMKNISNLKFFIAKPSEAISLYFDKLELH